jgi:beta-lactam-binding protein with PASTA domain
MSLGGSGYYTSASVAIRNLAEAGFNVHVAAGNNNGDASGQVPANAEVRGKCVRPPQSFVLTFVFLF